MDDTRDLIDRLCALAGMIMEDVSAVAILTGGATDAAAKIEQIRAAAADIAILAEAASVLLGRGEVRPRP